MVSHGQSGFDVRLPVEAAINEELEPANGFGVDVKGPRWYPLFKFPAFGPVLGRTTRSLVGKYSCNFRLGFVGEETALQGLSYSV